VGGGSNVKEPFLIWDLTIGPPFVFRKTFLAYDLRLMVARCCCHANLLHNCFFTFDQGRLAGTRTSVVGYQCRPTLTITSVLLLSFTNLGIYINTLTLIYYSDSSMPPPRHMKHNILHIMVSYA
jgi:hypothetical protein